MLRDQRSGLVHPGQPLGERRQREATVPEEFEPPQQAHGRIVGGPGRPETGSHHFRLRVRIRIGVSCRQERERRPPERSRAARTVGSPRRAPSHGSRRSRDCRRREHLLPFPRSRKPAERCLPRPALDVESGHVFGHLLERTVDHVVSLSAQRVDRRRIRRHADEQHRRRMRPRRGNLEGRVTNPSFGGGPSQRMQRAQRSVDADDHTTFASRRGCSWSRSSFHPGHRPVGALCAEHPEPRAGPTEGLRPEGHDATGLQPLGTNSSLRHHEMVEECEMPTPEHAPSART